jgi:ParB-like chromosome segregation protein Spo0J
MKRQEPVGAAAAEYVTLDKLHAWPKNPDPPSAKNVRELARSIRRFGFGAPMLARLANGEIIAGHARFLAAKRIKLDTVPVRFMDLTEGEAHLLALADNKHADNRVRDWTGDAIKEILEEAEAEGSDVENGTGFSEKDIDGLLGGDEDAEGGPRGKGGDGEPIESTFEILVTCEDEVEQAALLERFVSEGLKVKALLG